METKKIDFNGTNIHVSMQGDMSKRPIVFIHGNSLSGHTFKNQVESLEMPLVLIDLPGHGSSQPAHDPETVYSIPGYAKAITFAIEQLQAENFILAGHSLGGHIAINAAPMLKNIKGLLIFGTPPLDSVSSLGQAFLPNPLFPFLLQGPLTNEEASQLAGSMLSLQQHKDSLKRDILKTDPSVRSSFGAFVARGIIEDEVQIIRSLNFPVAVLHGEHDSYISKEYIEGLGFSNLWKNKVHSIGNSGHCPQLEQYAAFNALLTDYYNSVFS